MTVHVEKEAKIYVAENAAEVFAQWKTFPSEYILHEDKALLR
jgi:hypothetical protein